MTTTLFGRQTGGLHPDLPTAVLHDHLDGGLRPATIIELADAVGHQLPSTDEHELARWFIRGAEQRGLCLDEIVQAVQDGLAEGMAEASTPGGFPIVVNTIICALRTERRSLEIAELAAR